MASMTKLSSIRKPWRGTSERKRVEQKFRLTGPSIHYGLSR